MIKIGIIGAAGYTAGELIRILLNHPEAHIAWALSESQAGLPVTHIHDDLVGSTSLTFTQTWSPEVDVVFMCGGHGASRKWLAANALPETVRIIDLSTDYRMAGDDHDFVYGLPELNRGQIQQAHRVANPGCFATAIQLGLLPAAAAGILPAEVHIHAVTGSTGAGQRPEATTHFSWRNNNLSIYKAFQHQHLAEIGQTLQQLQPTLDSEVLFIPVRGGFARGIFATTYFHTDLSLEEATAMYASYYEGHPFTVVTAQSVHLKMVVNTNKAVIGLEKHGSRLLVTSVIDNLLKGASGQAVQNMNLMFGLPESTGLNLKASAF